MRTDLHHIGRRKGRGPKAQYRQHSRSEHALERRWGDLDDAPERESHRVRRVRGSSFDYEPLRRSLRAQVGRPWDEVYSEICRLYDARSHRGWELRQRVADVVDSRGEWRQWSSAMPDYREYLYVDECGILRENTRRSRRRAQRRNPVFRVIEERKFVLYAGVWHEIDGVICYVAQVPEPLPDDSPFFDLELQQSMRTTFRHRNVRPRLKPLPIREARQLGLVA